MNHDARQRLLRALPAALHALGVRDDAAPGGAHATLVCLVTQVSLEPPLVAVALALDGTTLAFVQAAGAFTLAPLPPGARGLAQRLGRRGREAPAKCADLPTIPGPVTGAPIVTGGAGWLECRVHAVHVTGDHALVIGAVVEAGLAAALPTAPGTSGGAVDANGAPVEGPALLTVAATGWRYAG